MSKKILQILNSYAPAFKFGGGNKIMFEYARLLNDKGGDITVYTTDVKDDHSRLDNNEKSFYVQDLDIKYFYNYSTVLSSKYNITISPTLWWNILFKSKGYDYIHICEFRGVLPLLVLLVCKYRKIKLIHSGFGMLSSRPLKPWKENILLLYDLLISRRLINNINTALCQSEREVLSYRKFGYIGECVIIPNYVGEKSGCIKYKNVFSKNEDINVIFIARIHPSKGVISAVKLIEQLNMFDYKYVLHIIGNDEGDLLNLTNYIKNNNLSEYVKYLGPIYGQDRFSFYKDSDAIILLPGQDLSTPLSFIEALTENCFVIFNNNSYLEGGVAAMAGINVDEVDDIKNIHYMLSRKKYGSKPYEFYKEKLSTQVVENILVSKVFV